MRGRQLREELTICQALEVSIVANCRRRRWSVLLLPQPLLAPEALLRARRSILPLRDVLPERDSHQRP